MEHDNESIRIAIKLYLTNQELAIETYGHIEEWNVSNVTNMCGMFCGAREFNQDISQWNVSNVTNMRGMFCGAREFNQDISQWNVSNVTNMSGMCCNAYKFNQNISQWNVSNVIGMDGMFYNARNFNQNISQWNVSNVINMSYMFCDAYEFNQDISQWNVSNVTNMNQIINNTKLSALLNKYNHDNKICFNKQIVGHLFSYKRRKSFIHFLIENGFEPLNNELTVKNEHKIFDTHDINHHIMSFV